MTITAITITSSKKDTEIGIGERIDYSGTATGWTTGEKVTITLRKASDDSVVITKTITPTAVAFTGSILSTWELKTSRTVGDYYLYAAATANTNIHTNKLCVITVIILSAWMMKYVYLAGINLTDADGTALDDAVLEMARMTAIDQVEVDTKIYWYPKTVMTQPTATDTYDIAIDRLTYIRKDFLSAIGYINLPHYYIQSVSHLYGYLNTIKSFDIHTEWLSVRKKQGMIQIIPSTATHASIYGTIGFAMLLGNVAEDCIPKFWDIKYVAGWDESKENFPKDLLAALGKRAVIESAPIISDALRRGISSQSLGMDGLSESESAAVSGLYALFSARVDLYQKQYDRWLTDYRRRHRGITFTVA